MKSFFMRTAATIALVLSVFCLQAADTKTYRDNLTPRTLSDWQDAPDGKLSVCFAVDKTSFSAQEKVAVRCAVRNNTDKPITILRPFGDTFFATTAGLTILGPKGPVSYRGPMREYVLGTSSFMQLPAHTVVDETLDLSPEYLPDLGANGLYTIRYVFVSPAYPNPAPPDDFWQGRIKTSSVTILIQ